LKRLLGGGARDPIAYQLPLAWFDQQLPGDLLDSGLHWVWESSRGGKVGSRGVPERRRPTRLTRGMGPALTAELGEYDGDIGRSFIAFATEQPMNLGAQQLIEAIREFSKSSAGPLVAILFNGDPAGPSEFLVGRTPLPVLSQLLETWAARLGKPVDQISRAPGRALLRRVFLDPKAIASGVIEGFPPVE